MVFVVTMASQQQQQQHQPSETPSSIVEASNYTQMMALVDGLLSSHGAARAYLAEKAKCSPSNVQNEAVLIPLVVKQETESLKCAVEILLELYRDKELADHHDVTEAKLLSVLQDLLAYFLGINAKSQQVFTHSFNQQ